VALEPIFLLSFNIVEFPSPIRAAEMKLLATFLSLFAFSNAAFASAYASTVPPIDSTSPHAAGLALNKLENRALTCETILGKVIEVGSSTAL
jgi:hypothetical protein